MRGIPRDLLGTTRRRPAMNQATTGNTQRTFQVQSGLKNKLLQTSGVNSRLANN